jgi:hypothetical protein
VNEREPLTPTTSRRTMRQVWLGLCVSNVLLALWMLVKAPADVGIGSPFVSLYRPYFVGIALATAAASIWWKGRSIARREATHADFVNDTPEQLQARIRDCAIVWALCEAVALLGFTFGSLARDFTAMLPFVGGALLLFYLHRPTTWPGYAEIP